MISYCSYRLKKALHYVITSRYLLANIFYLAYAFAMVHIGIHKIEGKRMFTFYIFFGFIHLLNAIMYLWVWSGEKRQILSWFCLPDLLNVIGAFLYLISAFLYPYEYSYFDGGYKHNPCFYIIRKIEFVAAIVEMVASLGWVWQWRVVLTLDYMRQPESTLGRGFTLDDPDMWANISLVGGAFLYLKYSAEVLTSFTAYESNTLYTTADTWYLCNAVAYLICAARDCELLWFMPVAGRFPNFDALASAHFLAAGSGGEGGDEVWLMEGKNENALDKFLHNENGKEED